MLRIEDLGAKFAKQSGMSPDAFCQQLFQIAYFNEVGQTDSTYEAANTKRFMGGRTETIRSVTNESSFLQVYIFIFFLFEIFVSVYFFLKYSMYGDVIK